MNGSAVGAGPARLKRAAERPSGSARATRWQEGRMRLRFVGAAGAASEACGRRVGQRGEGRRMARTEIWKYRWWGQARIERSGGGGGQGVTDGAMFDLRICDGR